MIPVFLGSPSPNQIFVAVIRLAAETLCRSAESILAYWMCPSCYAMSWIFFFPSKESQKTKDELNSITFYQSAAFHNRYCKTFLQSARNWYNTKAKNVYYSPRLLKRKNNKNLLFVQRRMAQGDTDTFTSFRKVIFTKKKKKKLRKFNGMWCNARCSAFLKLLHQSHVTYLGNACTLDLNIMDGILEQLEHSLNISWNKTVFSLINKVIWSSSL